MPSPIPAPDETASSGRLQISRRQLLGGLGLGAAGVVTLAPAAAGAAAAAPARALAAPARALATPADRFGRMFPNLLPFIPAPDDRVRLALSDMGRVGGLMDANDNLSVGPIALITDPAQSAGNRDNPTHTAGTTFLGQFLDHDMTLDATSSLGQPTEPENTPNLRTPAFDLDSVYGGGPTGSPALYESDRVKLRLESGGLFEDVPRQANGTAILGDHRNDENIIIAGLQAAFIAFHNRVVDQLRGQGVPAARQFAEARRLVTWHYQWIILNEFLPQIVGSATVRAILTGGRRWYRPEPGPAFIPVEFQGAAYRFGHSMVRPSYRANLAGNPDGSPFFGMVFDPAGAGQADPVDLRGGRRARRRFI
ncbi:MAG TPA: peroxidase family protein, partial [Catenuloplanes sp.]